MRRPLATLLVACAGLLVLPSCAVQGLAFVRDDRVEITLPQVDAPVGLPFTVRWRSQGYDGRYAVFIDRSPMRPGKSLRSLVGEDDPCLADAACPNAAYLELRDIYVVDGNNLTVQSLSDRRGGQEGSDRHELTIVLLNERGERQGESAFVREFTIERDSS